MVTSCGTVLLCRGRNHYVLGTQLRRSALAPSVCFPPPPQRQGWKGKPLPFHPDPPHPPVTSARERALFVTEPPPPPWKLSFQRDQKRNALHFSSDHVGEAERGFKGKDMYFLPFEVSLCVLAAGLKAIRLSKRPLDTRDI
ncbi:hypothetical protein NDU88_001504 [Pleurodeles waltl]|uniref:Uncharacterized protein n=1 Tax=Pleurodeles waltl TaxID=8319 RepID=A0AAV7W1Q2_PLEWA|nr:hypothetical protein NDU88_001504 [Pleurodeles waltl]